MNFYLLRSRYGLNELINVKHLEYPQYVASLQTIGHYYRHYHHGHPSPEANQLENLG